jgi:hypothetical protein
MLAGVHRVAIFVHHRVDGAFVQQNPQLPIHEPRDIIEDLRC